MTGHRTGRRFTLVVQCVEHEGSLLVLAGDADRKRWWRDLVEPARVSFVRDGSRGSGIAHVIASPDEWAAGALSAFLHRYPLSARARGVSPDVEMTPASVPQLSAGAVMVRIDPDPVPAATT